MAAGISMDLGKARLGPGKIVVDAGLACRALLSLQERARRTGARLQASTVVVCSRWEHEVRDLVRRSSRCNTLLCEEPLDLAAQSLHEAPADRLAQRADLRQARRRVQGTFVDLAPPRPRSEVTASTTDAHIGPAANPRSYASRGGASA